MYNTDLPKREELPSTRRLIRSTLVAFATALVLLFTVILPAEYAIDPTGIGRLLGVTKMGEIKQQLAEEASFDALKQNQIVEAESNSPAISEVTTSEVNVEVELPTWTDEVSLELAPGAAAEIKLRMQVGKIATFEWATDQGHLNSALHGDGNAGESTSYRNGRAEPGHSGELIAKFDGTHGWFWRNRSDVTVTLTLRTKGEYSELKRVI